MNPVSQIPLEYVNTPIGKLLKNYNSGMTELFINVLKQISMDEFQRVCTWAHFDDKDIDQLSENPNAYKMLIDRCLSIFIQAVQIKQKFEKRYPESKIEYIEYDGTALHGDCRHWLIVDGRDGEEFDESMSK